jgi:hypothetical protein
VRSFLCPVIRVPNAGVAAAGGVGPRTVGVLGPIGWLPPRLPISLTLTLLTHEMLVICGNLNRTTLFTNDEG